MCVSIPAKVVSIAGQVAEVEINHLSRHVLLVASAQVGDWVLVYSGAALAVIDEESARETLQLIEALTTK